MTACDLYAYHIELLHESKVEPMPLFIFYVSRTFLVSSPPWISSLKKSSIGTPSFHLEAVFRARSLFLFMFREQIHVPYVCETNLYPSCSAREPLSPTFCEENPYMTSLSYFGSNSLLEMPPLKGLILPRGVCLRGLFSLMNFPPECPCWLEEVTPGALRR